MVVSEGSVYWRDERSAGGAGRPRSKGIVSQHAVARLKQKWAEEYQNWSRKSLDKQQWVHLWADGIHSGVRAEDAKLCALSVIGVDEKGHKHLLAIEDGPRESTQSWREVLLKLKQRGISSWLKLKHNITLLIFLTLILCFKSALSQPFIEELQRLNFGTLAVSSNSSISRFTLPQTGKNLRLEGQFAQISGNTPGRYRFTGFPAFTTLNVSLDNTTLTSGANNFPEPLTVDSYDFDDVTTDVAGEAELSLGARLSTSGSGSAYVDAPYSGMTTLRVDYWQPDANAFVFNSTTIEIETELRSTVTLIEDQQLKFGTLFARTSTTDQASLILSPSGSYTVDEPNGSRLVVLAKPEQAIIRVVGAAPFYLLTLTPEATDIYLEHSEIPEAAPHFILNPLVTSPDGAATTDTNGELLIAVGGTLKTEVTASSVIYPSGEYEGTYEITVSY